MSGSWSNSFQSSLTLPTGATSGARIVLDGTADTITVYDANNNVVDEITPAIGFLTQTTSGRIAQLVNGGAGFAATNPFNYFGQIFQQDFSGADPQHVLRLQSAKNDLSVTSTMDITVTDGGSSFIFTYQRILADSGPHALTLGTNIAAHTSLTPSVMLMPDGTAMLRGSIQSSAALAAGAVLATVPAGYATNGSDFYPTTYSIGAGPASTYVTIQTNGQIVYNGGNGTLSYLFLGGIRYPVTI